MFEATVQRRPWTLSLRGVEESPAKLMQQLPLMPTRSTCQGPEAGTRVWPGAGTGSAGLT